MLNAIRSGKGLLEYLCAVARVLALDYGGKRTGIASTDPLQIIASPLETVETAKLMDWFKSYLSREEVEALVIGEPMRHDGTPSAIESEILKFIDELRKPFPQLPVYRVNEMFTSKEAMRSLVLSGVPKKKRKDKNLLDSISATLILQEFLQNR